MPPSVTVAAFVFGMVLLLAALVGKDMEIAAIKLPALAMSMRVVAGVLGAALIYVGLFNPFQSDVPAGAQVAAVTATAPLAPSATAPPPAATPAATIAQATSPAPAPTATGTPDGAYSASPDLDATTLQAIEPLLARANILLSAGGDASVERVRGYFEGPESAYHMLAVAALKVTGERRFMKPVHLDIIDKWYTRAAGSGYAQKGPLDLQKVAQALLQAHNDFYGDYASALDSLLEPSH